MPLETRSELFRNTAANLHNTRGKAPAVELDKLDTTVPPYSSNRSSALSSHPESARSYSASRTRSGKPPFAFELPKTAQQQFQPNKPLPEAPQPRRSPRDYVQKLLTSPRFMMQPPLSARSAAFIVNLQETFLNTVDTYLYRRYDGSSRSPPHQQDWARPNLSGNSLEAQSMNINALSPNIVSRLGLLRVTTMVVCALLMVTVLSLMIVFAQPGRMGMKNAAHVLMGGSAILVLLAAALMFAARRSLGEILVMAMLAVLICQCVMGDFHAG